MTTVQSPLSGDEQNTLRARADQLAQHGHYLADVVQAALNPNHPEVQMRARDARDRILNRPEPESNTISIGSAMVPDSTMVLHLAPEDQQACLEKLVAVAGDQRESASNRQDALTGAYNLVIDQLPALKATTFRASHPFALGEFDGSRLDEFTGPAHPLSSFQINFGSASLRGHGLRLAAASATTPGEQNWVRDQATELLRSADESDVLDAALVLSQLPRDVTADIDAHALADHGHIAARQLSAVLCVQDLGRYDKPAKRLAVDPSVRVRRTLAEAAATLADPDSPEAAKLLDQLRKDPHSSIRAIARGPLRR
ncbi:MULTISPECIES: hypothetical protein [unclassified Streptomyces]|uniref:hypothetical protein n=1 Tax=unclassified Streptomyces TaxID=2593676 RepID=UPI0036A08385